MNLVSIIGQRYVISYVNTVYGFRIAKPKYA